MHLCLYSCFSLNCNFLCNLGLFCILAPNTEFEIYNVWFILFVSWNLMLDTWYLNTEFEIYSILVHIVCKLKLETWYLTLKHWVWDYKPLVHVVCMLKLETWYLTLKHWVWDYKLLVHKQSKIWSRCGCLQGSMLCYLLSAKWDW